jgi:hypothetical protein
MRDEISPHAARELVRYLEGGAQVMCGSLHPDDFPLAQRHIEHCKRVLFAIIDGRVRVVKRPRTK